MIVQEIICSLFKLGPACLSMPIDKLLIEYLLVPSVIAIIFIYITSDFLLRETSTGIKGLVSIILYIVLVYSGFYGVFASFAYNYVLLFLIIGAGLFFLERLIAREWISGGAKGAGILIKKLKEKTASERDLRMYIAAYTSINNEINRLREREGEAKQDGRSEEANRLARSIRNAEDRKEELRWRIINLATILAERGTLSNDMRDKLGKIGIKI